MRNPIIVLDNLAKKTKENNYKFQRLYRNLYNKEFYLMAYSNIYSKEGNMTKGIDSNTIDGMSLKRIEGLIELLKSEKYFPNPVRRTHIPKANGNLRPLGIPSFDDKLIQEVIRMILDAIYDKTFSEKSHGFRKNHSCHTALINIKTNFTGCRWFVEGDIKSFFDEIDHHTLIDILKEKIDDEKFIRLIWKFLRAGYIENWKYNKTMSGTPQGSIISPLLSNIYLDKLDKKMEELIQQWNGDKKSRRKVNPEYKRLEGKIYRFKKKHKENWENYSEDEKYSIAKEFKALKHELLKIEYTNPSDENYKRIQYTRYADDFLIGIIGSKEDAQYIKDFLSDFLKRELKLTLSQEKTLITNTRDKARFLGYDISVSREKTPRKTQEGNLTRSKYLTVDLYIPKEKWFKKLIELDVLEITKDNRWKGKHRPYLSNLDDLEIIRIYNTEIRGLYNYFSLAKNVNTLHKFLYIMKISYLKTMANKYKSSTGKIAKKHKLEGVLGIWYESKKGKKFTPFYNEGFKINRSLHQNPNIDILANTQIYKARTSLIDRLNAGKCEWCGATDVPIEIHHVKKLKDLKGKKKWEQLMIARKRKTLALCAHGSKKNCHNKLHTGKLD